MPDFMKLEDLFTPTAGDDFAIAAKTMGFSGPIDDMTMEEVQHCAAFLGITMGDEPAVKPVTEELEWMDHL